MPECRLFHNICHNPAQPPVASYHPPSDSPSQTTFPLAFEVSSNCIPTNTPTSRLVLDTLTPLPTDRKCFRMINGVLVERTVGDVLPQLQSNSDNMNKVLVELAKQYKTKQDDMEKWKVSFRV